MSSHHFNNAKFMMDRSVLVPRVLVRSFRLPPVPPSLDTLEELPADKYIYGESSGLQWGRLHISDTSLPTDDSYDVDRRYHPVAQLQYRTNTCFLKSECVNEFVNMIDKHAVTFLCGPRGSGKTTGVMLPIIEYFRRRRVQRFQQVEYDVENYQEYYRNLPSHAISDMEKILFVHPNSVSAENFFRWQTKAMTDWRMRLHIDGHIDSPYMRLQWPQRNSDDLDVDYVPGGVKFDQLNLRTMKQQPETDFDVKTRTDMSPECSYFGAITTYRNSITMLNDKFCKFGFVVLDGADYPSTIEVDAALRSALLAYSEGRCARIIVIAKDASFWNERCMSVVKHVLKDVADAPVFSTSNCCPNVGNIDSSPTHLLANFDDTIPSCASAVLPFVVPFPACDMLAAVNRERARGQGRLIVEKGDVDKMESLELDTKGMLSWNTRMTIAVTEEAMKNVVRAYGIRDSKNPKIYHDIDSYLGSYNIPDIMVVCRNGVHANEVAKQLMVEEMKYVHPRNRRNPNDRFQFGAFYNKNSVFQLQKIFAPWITYPYQLLPPGKQMMKQNVGSYQYASGANTAFRCGRLVIGTRESLFGYDLPNLVAVVDSCFVTECIVRSASGLTSSKVRLVDQVEAEAMYACLGRRNHMAHYLMVADQRRMKDIFRLRHGRVGQVPNVMDWIQLFIIEERFQQKLISELPSQASHFTEEDRQYLRNEAITCGFVVPSSVPDEPDMLRHIVRVGATVLPTVHPEMSCFLIACARFGLLLHGVVAVALDMCQWRLFKHISLDAEGERVEPSAKKPASTYVWKNQSNESKKRIAGVNVLGVFHKLCTYKTDTEYDSYNSDYIAGADAAVNLMSFLDFDLEKLAGAKPFYNEMRDRGRGYRIKECTRDEKEPEKVKLIVDENSPWSTRWATNKVFCGELDDEHPAYQLMLDLENVANLHEDKTVGSCGIMAKLLLTDDGRADFSKCFGMIVQELRAFEIIEENDEVGESDLSVPLFASSKYNWYASGKEGGYLLSKEGRHLFKALLVMFSSRFGRRRQKHIVGESFLFEDGPSGKMLLVQSPSKYCGGSSTETFDYTRYHRSSSQCYGINSNSRDSAFFTTVVDQCTVMHMVLFSNVMTECHLIDGADRRIQVNYMASCCGDFCLYGIQDSIELNNKDSIELNERFMNDIILARKTLLRMVNYCAQKEVDQSFLMDCAKYIIELWSTSY